MSLLDLVRGATFDDFLFTPQLGIVPSRDPSSLDLSARFTEHLTLKRPIVSANMDTITRSAMAVVVAEEGGIGIVDRGFRAGDIAPQVAEVLAVKRTQHGIIEDPHAQMLVRRNDVDGVHGDPPARTKRKPRFSLGGDFLGAYKLALA